MERPDSLDTSDIDGAQSKRLPRRDSSHPFNSNLDIEFSRPYSRTSNARSTRATDPLNPAYRLPSVTHDPLPMGGVVPRDPLWTLPQSKWKPETRHPVEWTDLEKYGRDFLFRKTVPARSSLVSVDITGPQFRVEEPRWRKTDPLHPVYVYDGGPLEEVNPRRPHYGSMYPRAEAENFALKTDDIMTEQIFTREYPKELIKTRPANRTDDILGAQSNTWCPYPSLWKSRDPSRTIQKETNRVKDIEGAVAGTGASGPLLYRTRKQAAMNAPSSAAAAARAADIQAVKALP